MHFLPLTSHHARAAVVSSLCLALQLTQIGCGSSEASETTTVVTMPSVALAPGQETTQCVVIQLSNTTPQMLRRVHSAITAGSHHLIAYRAPAGTPQQLTPTPCPPFADVTNGVTPVIIAESSDAEVTYPDHVALPLAANQMIKLEEHFLNASDDALQSGGTVELTLVDPDPSLIPANLVLWGPEQFQISAHAAGTADFAHAVMAGINIFAMTTHEHHFGTLATIDVATNAEAPGAELYRNTDWEHPPLKAIDPPMAFDGTQELRLHCEWLNTSDLPVPFGLSAATNEMCFFWAYYYPSQGFQVCNERGCKTQ
jgi:hypothetical protein